MASTRTFTLSTVDGLRLHGVEWQKDDPKGVVALLHGLGEHIERYHHVAEALTKGGFAVVGFDQRGHGISDGKRGHTPNYAMLMDSITLLLQTIHNRYPGQPVWLYGHSFGGNQVLNYALRYPDKIDGVIASGPWLKLVMNINILKVGLSKVAYYLLPRYTESNRVEARLTSHDPAMVKAYATDPLIHDRVTARLFVSTQRAGLWAIQQAGNLQVPALVMHGGDDPLTAPDASRQFCEQAGELATYKEWHGMYHEIHNEVDRQEVLDYLVDWLKNK